MDLGWVIARLKGNAARIQALVKGLSESEARWNPEPGSWSSLEVVNHLLDEEREDFRVRIEITLFHPDDPWPPIDPERWVVERAYNERELGLSLAAFLEERETSLKFLKGLEEPNWDASYEARFGTIRAGDLLAAWVAHDILHQRQLIELQYARMARDTAPYSPRYAGEW